MRDTAKKVYIKTWGCQMNEHDSQVVQGLLREEGYQPVATEEEADVIYLNTCSVREKAENKLYSQLGRYKHLKKDNPGLKIAVAGCVAQQEKDTILQRAPHVDLVVGTHQFRKIADLVDKAGDNKGSGNQSSDATKTQWIMGDADVRFDEPVWSVENSAFSAMLTIMEGCDQVCSYCIVPFTRGREISRPPQEVLSRARGYAEQGIKELMLLGQNVNAYGKKDSSNGDFVDLLYQVAEIPGLERIRFTSPHPQDFSERLAIAYRDLPNLCPQAHIPVQAGNNEVLSGMKRSYTREIFLDTVAMLRDHRPDIALSTDIIVGFPGESYEQYLDTISLMEEVRFDQVFSFVYSARPFTPARKLEDPVPHATKMSWLHQLQEKQKEIQLEIHHALLGSQVKVLISDYNADKEALSGRTPQNRLIHIPVFDAQPELWKGRTINVKIQKAMANSLRGSYVTP